MAFASTGPFVTGSPCAQAASMPGGRRGRGRVGVPSVGRVRLPVAAGTGDAHPHPSARHGVPGVAQAHRADRLPRTRVVVAMALSAERRRAHRRRRPECAPPRQQQRRGRVGHVLRQRPRGVGDVDAALPRASAPTPWQATTSGLGGPPISAASAPGSPLAATAHGPGAERASMASSSAASRQRAVRGGALGQHGRFEIVVRPGHRRVGLGAHRAGSPAAAGAFRR